MQHADVAIVGAGVIGCAIAYHVARVTRLRVVVLERGTPGCEASGAAAGVLAFASGQARRGALFDLRRRSAGLFPELVAALEEETGLALEYRRTGLLMLACSDAEAAALADLVCHRTAQGLRCEMLDSAAAVRALEPAVGPTARAGALFHDDHAINSERLVTALAAAAQRRGVEFHSSTPVRGVCHGADAVQLDCGGTPFEAGTVVIAAGAWSAQPLAMHPIKIPVRPARGEMASVDCDPLPMQRTIAAGDGYLVPRSNGEVLIGSTTAFVGFDKRVTATGVSALLARAAAMVPAVGRATVRRTWAGLRPCPTIRRPIIAPLPGLERVILATGHHRNGILLAPVTAQMVGEMITGSPPSVPLRPFSYRKH